MNRIEQQRKLLENKLKEMAEDGVMKTPQKETLAFDPPDEQQVEKPRQTAETKGQTETTFIAKEPDTTEKETLPDAIQPLSMDDYRTRYLISVRIREKTAFTMNVETLQILRNVLQDLGERVSMASYIDNILREHLRRHKDLINNATSRQRRRNTINI